MNMMRYLVLVLVLFCSTFFPVTGFPITMDECVSLALNNNSDIHKQKLGVQIAKEDFAGQKMTGFGSLKLVSSYTHYNLSRTLAPLTPASIASDPTSVPTTNDLYTVGVVYELPLFTGFSMTSAVQVSSLQKEIASSMLKLSREQLIYNVKSVCSNIMALDAQAEAQSRYVTALQELVSIIDGELALGRKARIDLLKANADLKAGQATLQRIVTNRGILLSSLYRLLGVRELPALEAVQPQPEMIVKVGRQKRPEGEKLDRLRVAELEVEKNSYQLRKTRSSLYPQIVFNSSYGQNFGPNDDSHLNSGDLENQEVWQAGLHLQWEIMDFGVNRSKIRKAELIESQNRYEQSKIILELEQSLKDAVDKINLAVVDYESAGEELRLTEQTEEIEQVRYEQGVSTTNDLLYAKSRKQLANGRFITAGYAYLTARYSLDYLLEQGERNTATESYFTSEAMDHFGQDGE